MNRKTILLIGLLILLAGGASLGIVAAQAHGLVQSTAASQNKTLHPRFAFLDEQGRNVLDSGQPLSTMQTCGQCHDTTFIVSHSFHSDLGLSNYGKVGDRAAHPWDLSDGLFGKWDPLIYRYLSAPGDDRPDLGVSSWIQIFANRL